jgi:putative hemolysin
MHGRPASPADTYIDVSDAAKDWLKREALVRPRSAIPPVSTPAAFAEAALQKLAIRYQYEPRDLNAVPRSGRVIFIANHPFGALDGLIAIALLGELRRDLKVFANEDLCALHELKPMLLPIEVLGRQRAKCNVQTMRQAMRWLEGEGALMMFPAGAVSQFDARARCVTDPPWSRAVAMLARKARAAVVPLHFTGGNRLLFQVAGFMHPRLRTLMLPGELERRAGTVVPVRVGAPLPYERL